jgi:murein DD-endopeptidase MepM/ murein hydrolase activator NlpD
MQPREAGVFALGFAAGALVLVLLLWVSGGLRTGLGPTPADNVAHAMAGPEIPPPSLSDFSAPPLAHEPIPTTSGDADRLAPDRTGLLGVPVFGVTSNQLYDNFEEIRGGHKHEAIDIPAPRGTPVLAAAEGNVTKLFTSKDGGLTVYQFDDSGTWCYYYAHLDRYAPALKEGMLLRKGDVLGYVGTTGNASPNAPHLHFAIFRLGPEKHWWKGTAVDPLPMLKGEGRP